MLEGLQMCENEPNFDSNIFTIAGKAGVDSPTQSVGERRKEEGEEKIGGKKVIRV